MAVGAHSRSPGHMIGAQAERLRETSLCMSWSSSWRSWGGLWTSAALALELCHPVLSRNGWDQFLPI